MTFALPAAFWAFAAFPPLIAFFLLAEKNRRALLDRLIAARLQPRLAGSVSIVKRRAAFLLALAALALSVLALAQPRWGFTWEERTERGRDILIAFDTSRSMLAQDPKPNRITRAKLAAQDLIAQLEGDRVGVIAFAGSSFLQAPLTADFAAVKDALSELDTEIIPLGGTNLTAAIQAADDAFGKGESDQRALIIFTDGEELEEDSVATAREHSADFRIYTVGLGSAEGGLIPVPTKGGGTEFVRDDSGAYVTSRLDEKRLREVAEAAGGFYVHLTGGPAEMNRIVTDGLGKMKDREADSQFRKAPIERYHWPLTGAVACFVVSLLLGERKRLARVTASLVIFLPRFAISADLPALEAERAKRPGVAQLDYNVGYEAFKAGELGKAAEAFGAALGTGTPQLQSKAAYNLANTLARRGAAQKEKDAKKQEWQNAIGHYTRALELDPASADAKHNRDLVQKALDDLNKEEKKDDQQKQDKKDEEKKEDEKKDDEKKDSKGDGEKKDEQQQDKKDGKQEKKSEQKDEKSDEQKSQDGEKKDGEKKDDAGKPESKDGKKEDGEKKDGQQPDKDGEKNDGEQPGDKKDQPKPEPGEPDKDKKTGELKAANPAEKGDKEDPAAEAAEAMAAAQEGRMTVKDAKQLLEARRSFDRRVKLLDPREAQQPRPAKGFKNW